MTWNCNTCGRTHAELPLSFAADFPDNYANMSTEQRELRAVISSDQCIIDGTEFYLRGCLEIPILSDNGVFIWGVWACIWEHDFDEISDAWETEGRESRSGAYKGRLANGLNHAYFPPAVNLPLTIKLRPVGTRPLFLVDDVDHPIAKAQREGMTIKQVEELVAKLLH